MGREREPLDDRFSRVINVGGNRPLELLLVEIGEVLAH
jgi:hypothetical protein